MTVLFASDMGGDFDIYSQPADGSRPAELLLKRHHSQYPVSVGPDGTVAFAEAHPVTGEDLWLLSPDGKRVAVVARKRAADRPLVVFDEVQIARGDADLGGERLLRFGKLLPTLSNPLADGRARHESFVYSFIGAAAMN